MARFFQNLDDEEKQVKKKTAAVLEEEKQTLSKTDRKLAELEAKISELQSATKHFEKMARKFFGELKKYTKVFENNKLPKFLLDIFKDERILKSAAVRSSASEFLNLYPEEKRLILGFEEESTQEAAMISTEGQLDDKKNEKILEGIMEIISDIEKEQELIEFSQGDIAPEKKCAVAITLLSIYSKTNNFERMMWVLEEFTDSFKFKSQHATIFKRRINSYLGRIYKGLSRENYDRYSEMLDKLYEINPDVVSSRRLEMKFFRLSISPETEDLCFKLLYLVRKGEWGAARDYFIENKAVFIRVSDKNDTSIRDMAEDTMNINILYEFAELAILNEEFFIAYEALVYCHENLYLGLELKIYALCIILGEEVGKSAMFQAFLDNFKLYDLNIFLLKSQNRKDELFKSFYLLHVYDYIGAAKIIYDVVGFRCEHFLKDMVNHKVELGYK